MLTELAVPGNSQTWPADWPPVVKAANRSLSDSGFYPFEDAAPTQFEKKPVPPEIGAVQFSLICEPETTRTEQVIFMLQVDYQDFAMFYQSWLDCNLDPPEACWE